LWLPTDTLSTVHTIGGAPLQDAGALAVVEEVLGTDRASPAASAPNALNLVH